ncbi:MAG: hypothetical protein ACRC0G_01275 [Fusobacteriaceae bacterium]
MKYLKVACLMFLFSVVVPVLVCFVIWLLFMILFIESRLAHQITDVFENIGFIIFFATCISKIWESGNIQRRFKLHYKSLLKLIAFIIFAPIIFSALLIAFT